MKRTLLVIAPLLVIVVLGYVWGRHWMSTQLAATPAIELEPPIDCALERGPCVLVVPGHGRLQVEFSEEPVPLQPFRVQLHAPGMQLEAASADFQMVDMYMGVNRYTLQRQSDAVWSREVMLPVCATGRSDWLMHLRVAVGDAEYRVALPFEAAAARR